MKIIRNITSISAAIALAAAMTSCSNKSDSDKKQYERTAPDSVSFEWQKAYESKLNEFKESEDYSDNQESGSAFDLFDITKDGTPELIISPNNDGSTKCLVYSFSDGEAAGPAASRRRQQPCARSSDRARPCRSERRRHSRSAS